MTGGAKRRGGFTLIELLVIVAIICAMAGVGVVSVRAGQGAARVKGATRDIFAAIRHARSQALVSQKPVIITYSTEEIDGEPMAKIEMTSAKLVADEIDRAKIRTLMGEPLAAPKRELVSVRAEADTDGDAATGPKKEDGGSLVQDVLFAPIKEDVVKGMRLKVVLGDEGLGETAEKIAAGLGRDSDSGGRRLMIEVDGHPAGEMNYRRVDTCTAEIGIKICDPSCRDRGLGKRLLCMLIGELLGPMGYRRIVLDTNLNNRRVQHIYEQLGFRRLGVRKDSWRDQLGALQSAVDYELRPEDFISYPGPARP